MILIIGSDAPAGLALIARLESAGLPWQGIRCEQCREPSGLLEDRLASITNTELIVDLFDQVPRQFPVASSLEPFFEVNTTVSRCVGEYDSLYRVPLIYLSSFEVFDGRKKNPYIAANALSPISHYGQSKAAAERELLLTVPRLLVLRQGFPLDERPGGWLDRVVRDLLSGEPIEVADQPVFNPTPVEDLARVIMAVLQQVRCGVEAWGAYHYGGSEAVSHASLVMAVVEHLHHLLDKQALSGQIKPVNQLSSWPMPVNGRLSCIKIRNTFGIKQRPWRSTLAALVQSRLDALREPGALSLSA